MAGLASGNTSMVRGLDTSVDTRQRSIYKINNHTYPIYSVMFLGCLPSISSLLLMGKIKISLGKIGSQQHSSAAVCMYSLSSTYYHNLVTKSEKIFQYLHFCNIYSSQLCLGYLHQSLSALLLHHPGLWRPFPLS